MSVWAKTFCGTLGRTLTLLSLGFFFPVHVGSEGLGRWNALGGRHRLEAGNTKGKVSVSHNQNAAPSPPGPQVSVLRWDLYPSPLPHL